MILNVVPVGAAKKMDNPDIGGYSFLVEIEGVTAGEFISVEGLSIEQQVIEYQNGDDPLTRKRPGRVAYGDLTLTKAYMEGSVLNDWIEASRVGNGDYNRKSMSIVLVDKNQTEIKRWNCFGCFPKSWKLLTLDGKGKGILVEETVIVIEWFEEA